MKHKTREGWLVAAIVEIDKTFFKDKGYKLPKKLQVSCGFARGVSRAIGQCFPPERSADKTTQMFVCPSMGDAVKVLATLLHEMIHASVSCKVGHRGAFRKLAKEFGLAGKMTATFAEEGSDLHKKLKAMFKRLGKYPHAALEKSIKLGTRRGWIRLVSPHLDTYRITISPVMLEESGAPLDPWGNEMLPVGR